MIGPIPACVKCNRLIKNENGWSCLAYPIGGSIPDEILSNGNDHTTPVPGDHGVRFEPIE